MSDQVRKSVRNFNHAAGRTGLLELALSLVRQAALLSRCFVAVSLAMLVASPAWGQKQVDLADQSLTDLMNISVTSVSKKEQKLSRTASAIFVITAEDIRRSGATNIPDLLRMVPGLNVAQINANTWAVTARGFNARFSNDLLVLLDGRSVYTPTFDGVYWDVLDLPLEDIDRIEVIRGPGASVWATNAINGVVNIITKKTSETQGGFAEVAAGNVNQGFGTVQYGGSIGRRTSFRAFVKYLNANHFPNAAGQDGGDGWNDTRIGVRADTNLSANDSLTFEGDLYRGREGNASLDFVSVGSPLVETQNEVNLGGGFLQAVWNRRYSDRSGMSIQASYDEYERNDFLGETRGTSDITFQHHFGWGDRQDLIWGLEYRYSQSRAAGDPFFSLDPPDLKTSMFSGFVQDEIAVVPDILHVTLGTKLEHDNYTGFDVLPTARLTWTPDTKQTIWAAVSEAARQPGSIDVSLRSFIGGFMGPSGPVEFELMGNPKIKDEGSIAYEAGYRLSVNEELTLDFSSYYNRHSNQETVEPGVPFFETTPAPPHMVVPLVFGNLMHGETHGFEMSGNWKPVRRWTLSPGYAFEGTHMHLLPTSQDTASVAQAQGSTPVNSAQLRSHVDIASRISWDTSAYFVGRLTDPEVSSYTRLDTALTWQWTKMLSLSAVGQNLLKDRHEEFVDYTGSAGTTLIRRSAYVKATWHF